MIENFKKVVFENYANFSGRARRREYWLFVLATVIFSFLLGIVLAMVGIFSGLNDSSFEMLTDIVQWIYSAAMIVPTFAVVTRRLHDIGKSGWNYFWGFLPVIGWILLLVWMCKDGEPGVNQYGPNPKGGNNASFKDDESLEIVEKEE